MDNNNKVVKEDVTNKDEIKINGKTGPKQTVETEEEIKSRKQSRKRQYNELQDGESDNVESSQEQAYLRKIQTNRVSLLVS